MGDGTRDAVHQGARSFCSHPVQDNPVEAVAGSTQRRPVSPGQLEHGGLLPGRGQRDAGVQSGEQSAARPGGFPPQR
jgi:hypothetical protein